MHSISHLKEKRLETAQTPCPSQSRSWFFLGLGWCSQDHSNLFTKGTYWSWESKDLPPATATLPKKVRLYACPLVWPAIQVSFLQGGSILQIVNQHLSTFKRLTSPDSGRGIYSWIDIWSPQDTHTHKIFGHLRSQRWSGPSHVGKKMISPSVLEFLEEPCAFKASKQTQSWNFQYASTYPINSTRTFAIKQKPQVYYSLSECRG